MRNWDKILPQIANDNVKQYYIAIKRKWFYRIVKRIFDVFASIILISICFLPSLVIGLLIVLNSSGGMFFLQTRIGRYGKPFKIIKFRTMKRNSEGNQQITHKNDSRVTGIGKFLRKTHIDEIPQLINVLIGQMSFVGTRPEVKRFVDQYKDEWYATLLMRPGITSTASYSYDDEAKDIREENADSDYINIVLPKKMKLNLEDIEKMSVFRDVKIMFKTLL